MNLERWDRNALLVFVGLILFAAVIGILWHFAGG
jgi:hypothetical protein